MRNVITLDESWTAGEIPPALQIQLLDPPVSLDGWELQVRFERDGKEVTPAHGTPVDWVDAELSLCKVNFGAGDMAVTGERSEFRIEVWAAGAGQRIASRLIVNHIYENVGSDPTI